MDLSSSWTQAGITSSILFLSGVLYKIFKAINNKQCHSRCCNRDFDASIEVNDIPHYEQNPMTINGPMGKPPENNLAPH